MLFIGLNAEYYKFKDEILNNLLAKVRELHDIKIDIKQANCYLYYCYMEPLEDRGLLKKISKILYDELCKIHKRITDELIEKFINNGFMFD